VIKRKKEEAYLFIYYLLSQRVSIQSDEAGQQRVKHELLVCAQLNTSKGGYAVQQDFRCLSSEIGGGGGGKGSMTCAIIKKQWCNKLIPL